MNDYSIKDHIAYSMGFKDGKESQAATIAGLQAAVIQCRSLTELLKPQADRIAELEAALKAAAEDIGDWGAYASQYLQEKWDLAGEVKRYTAIAEGKLPYRARSSMGEPEDE